MLTPVRIDERDKTDDGFCAPFDPHDDDIDNDDDNDDKDDEDEDACWCTNWI